MTGRWLDVKFGVLGNRELTGGSPSKGPCWQFLVEITQWVLFITTIRVSCNQQSDRFTPSQRLIKTSSSVVSVCKLKVLTLARSRRPDPADLSIGAIFRWCRHQAYHGSMRANVWKSFGAFVMRIGQLLAEQWYWYAKCRVLTWPTGRTLNLSLLVIKRGQ